MLLVVYGQTRLLCLRGWCPYADADIREMRTSTIGGVLMEPSIVEVAYLPSLLAEWELKSPAGKCPAVGDE